MGLESLKSRRDNHRCKRGGIKSIMNAERYPRLLLDSEWEVKQCRGRLRKTWRKVISELLLLLNLEVRKY